MIDNYEIVELSKLHIVGICEKITLQTPRMSLWDTYYKHAIQCIEHPYNTKAYGIYFDFDRKSCTYMVGCQAAIQSVQSEDIHEFTIPVGRYAKFSLCGEVHQVVPQFWNTLDSLSIQRRYLCDFEVFPSKETEDVCIEIFISIK